MKHIFISHAGADAEFAKRLEGDLRNAGHETKVDTRELKLGDDAIDFMNEGIAEAHTVIILYSRHTPNANWQKLEINSAVWNEVAQAGGVCVVVKLDDSPMPPVLGRKLYGKVDASDPRSYRKLLEDLCGTILPGKTASSLVSDAFRCESSNPFRRVRAEYFEDRPDLLAKTFAPPDALKAGALEEMKPCFLEGSRGTGKSMLLLSLRARNFLSRHKANSSRYKILGFYLKLSRGAICNAGVFPSAGGDPKTISERDFVQITDISSQEIIICILESLFSEIDFCIKQRLLPCDAPVEKALAEAAYSSLFGTEQNCPRSLEELLDRLADTHRKIADFIRRKFIYGEIASVPITTFDLDALKRVIKLVRKLIPIFSNAIFMTLLDEYENLFPYQQRIVNSYVKLAPPDASVKIAKKIGTADTSGTMTGQELQEIHDYTRVPLIYDVEDREQQTAYNQLLTHIVANLLGNEAISFTDMQQLLPTNVAEEVGAGELKAAVAKLCKVSINQFENWSSERQRERMTYYGEAATYRVLYSARGRHKPKHFSGFNQLAFLSSGVIRYFQEFLGVAYHLTYSSSERPPSSLVLPAKKQSDAVHFVSQHNLTTLSRNVEADGEILKYFLLDLGDCLRFKLLNHTSEPEAARLTIADPELLDLSNYDALRRILTVGAKEGIFQTKEGRPAFKPKHSSDPQPCEFNICRAYAPVLQISPRQRWRTKVKCKDLLKLLSPDQRAQAKKQLMATISKAHSDGMQPGLL
ncbi:MAG: toll/interleukin-1 receptor domain-containing protein [Verrucomicrobiales bacterium]|nr:toll/interleukin-1 receptor domain-containing protein [Verrucomicrobiales bacterium]